MGSEAEVLQIVEAALAIEDDAARTAWLDSRCADDSVLRQRIDRLLGMDETGFRLLRTDHFQPVVPDAEPIPDRFGVFRVTDIIGRGGMGAVVRAERDDGLFTQVVAIKLIRSDLNSERARARFVQERRILGRLTHPGIARILDGGDVAGQPYLVMDYVAGEPVTQALTERAALLDERLDAFIAVAEAVAHAHRNLIVHADIKPSNVLMTAEGSVKLLDFGISRLMADLDPDELAEPYPLTRGYAAPERFGGAQPTISGDVYSLGVLLHEMLTGEMPEKGVLMSAKASVGVIAPARLTGDLDAIVAKALAEDVAARYPDVASLLTDLRYFRSDIPVSAMAQSGWRYPAGKFIRRHRSGLLLSVLAFAGLLLAAVVSTALYLSAERARAEASARFADARGTARYLLFDLMPKLENQPRALPLRAEVANVAQLYLDRLSRAANAPDEVRFEAASGLWRLAEQQAKPGRPNLAQPEKAEANLRKAGALTVSLGGPRAAVLHAHILLDRVNIAAHMNADLPAADALLDRATAEATRAARHEPALLVDILDTRANLRSWQGRYAEADAAASEALALADKGPSRLAVLRRARLTDIRAEALFYGDNVAAALDLYRQEVAMLAAARDTLPSDNFILSRLARARWSAGTTYLEMQRPADALPELERGVAEARSALAFDPADKENLRIVRILVSAQAQALSFLGRHDEAIALHQSRVAEDRRVWEADRASVRLLRDYAYSTVVLGETLDVAGKAAQSCAVDTRAMTLYAEVEKRGRLTPLDRDGNLKYIAQRRARNCR